MSRHINRTAAIALSAIVVITMLGATAAYAGRSGRRNTALALSAATIYFLAKDDPDAALLSFAGAAYAWDRYHGSRRFYRYRDRNYYYYDRDRDRYWGRRHDNGRHLGWYNGRSKNWDRDRDWDRDRFRSRDRDRRNRW